eukprot:2936807-Rhodomonas_salina.1
MQRRARQAIAELESVVEQVVQQLPPSQGQRRFELSSSPVRGYDERSVTRSEADASTTSVVSVGA